VKTETRVGIFVLTAIGIFFYLSMNIGVIRLDRDLYHPYKAFFDDTGGLDVKSPVKIAGVEVGWVDSILLLAGGKAEVNMRVNKRNRLARNAYAIIQQEGLIGTKTLEIDPGDPSTGFLPPGSTLTMPGKSPASIGDLLDQFRDIASSIHDIALSFRNTFASKRGEENLKKSLDNIAEASEKIAGFSAVLDRTLKKNEQNLDTTLVNLKDVTGHLDTSIPRASDDFHELSSKLSDDVLPNFNEKLNKITLAFADDTLPKLSNMSDKASGAFESFDVASVHAGEGFKQGSEVMEKLNTGKGVLGKLINEDETYGDIKKTLRGFKNFVNKTQSLGVYVDMHSETLLKTTLSKGYVDIRLRPTHDYFYQIQLVADENGTILRDRIQREYRDARGNRLPVDALVDRGRDKIRFAEDVFVTKQRRNDILFGFQFGKRFNRVALRVGMFENTFGAAADYYLPLKTNKINVISSFIIYDLRGINRIKDTRPHLKWLNRAYFFRNLYTAFGIDDVISKRKATPFFGGGIRFNDDDLKYFMSLLSTGVLKR